MCISFISYNSHPDYKLIVASNRDEFLERPTLPMHKWQHESGIIAGKDLTHGGTWFGVTKEKFGLITNFRDFHNPRVNGPSRGLLLSGYLLSDVPAIDYLKEKETVKNQYDGFNLLIYDNCGLYFQSSKLAGFQKLVPGIYGLSNALLDTPWPKLVKGKKIFSEIIQKPDFRNNLFDLMKDSEKFPQQSLPDTGVGVEMEVRLSSIFIKGEKYGTRTTTVMTIDHQDNILISELTHSNNSLITLNI